MGLLSVTCVVLMSMALAFGDTNVPAGAVEFEEDVPVFEEPGNGPLLNIDDVTQYQDCDDILKRGQYQKPGAYLIYLNSSEPITVYCSFEEGFGRLVIMQQKYGHVSFHQTYQRYLYGFGSAHLGDFWYGLIKTKSLTDNGYNKLTMLMQDCNHTLKKVVYNSFSLGPFSDHFRLRVHSFDHHDSDLPDDLTFNNGMQFATWDKPDRNNCAYNQRGGWWYNHCTKTLPTGHYYQNCAYTPPHQWYDGIYYEAWHGYKYSLKYIRMDLSKH